MNVRTEKLIERLRKFFEKNSLQVETADEGVYMLRFRLKSETSELMDTFLTSQNMPVTHDTYCMVPHAPNSHYGSYSGYRRTSPVTLEMDVPYRGAAVYGKSFFELEKDEQWQQNKGKIPLLLGCRNDNSNMIVDLAQSECIVMPQERLPLMHVIIAGLLRRFSFTDLRIAVCQEDNNVELPEIPHLLTPCINVSHQKKAAFQLFDFLLHEMNRRIESWKSGKFYMEIKTPAIILFLINDVGFDIGKLLYLIYCGPKVGIYTIQIGDWSHIYWHEEPNFIVDRLVDYHSYHKYTEQPLAEDDMFLLKSSGELTRFLAGNISVEELTEISSQLTLSMPTEDIDMEFLRHQRQFKFK